MIKVDCLDLFVEMIRDNQRTKEIMRLFSPLFNLMWVLASNSSGTYSSWPSCIARPDGSLESLERGVPGILYREFPDDDRTTLFRSWTHNNKMMKLPEDEIYHNGTPSNHPRAVDTNSQP